MLRLNVLALFPEFALAFASDFIRPSYVIGGLGSQRNSDLPAKSPPQQVLEKVVTGTLCVLSAAQTREPQTSVSNFVNFNRLRGRRK